MTTLEVQEIHKAVVNIKVYPDTRSKLKILAAKEGLTMAELVHQLVKATLALHPKEAPNA